LKENLRKGWALEALHFYSSGKILIGTEANKVDFFEPERRRTFVDHGEV